MDGDVIAGEGRIAMGGLKEVARVDAPLPQRGRKIAFF
jgi:hypothetical protein